jgi:N-acetylglucosaminyl-diphospho-decaprenol L-rhamnosyltransferase
MITFVRPDLAVVIVTYNSAHDIGGLLDSLPAALDGLTADVVVVDNGSADGTADLVAARGDCRVVRSANVGYAGGINRGVREAAPAGAILILNPDARLSEHAVPPLLEALREPGTGIVVPQLRSADGALEPSLRREPTLLRALGLEKTGMAALSERVGDAAQYTYPHLVDWAQGAAVLMSRDCFEALQGWDESFFLYSEETDLSLRARDLGLFTRYEPRSVVVHTGGGSGRNDMTHATARRPPGATSGWPSPASSPGWCAGTRSRGSPSRPCCGRRCARPNWAARTGSCPADQPLRVSCGLAWIAALAAVVWLRSPITSSITGSTTP